MRRPPLLLLFGLLVAAVGCESNAPVVGGKARQTRVTSVVSLSPSTTELIQSLSPTGILKGRTQADNFPANIPAPIVASVKPDYEKIKSLSPNLIVYDASLYNDQDVQKLKALGFPLFPIDANNIDGFDDEVLKLAEQIGAETNASDYVDRIVASRSTAQADPINPKPKVAVMLVGQGTEDSIDGTDSFQADVVRAAGGDVVGPKVDHFVPLSPELLVSQNPDAIVIGVDKTNPDAAAKAVSALLADPRLKSVKAIAGKRILPIDADVLVRRGYRVDKLIDGLHKALASK